MASTILIVDDDEQIRDSLTQYLELRGHQVTATADAKSALQSMRHGVDLVLADQQMPAMTGLEMIREIKRHNLRMPFVMMTGFPEIATVQEAKALGISAFLKKPLDLKDLARRVDALLGNSDADRFSGKIFVLSRGLADTLGEKLAWATVHVYEEDEDADWAVEAIRRENPVVILGDVKNPFTFVLLDEYRKRNEDRAAFLITGEADDFDLIAEGLFERKADGAVMTSEAADAIQSQIVECVKRLEADQRSQRVIKETLVERCMYARSFQRGRYCVYQGSCPFRGSWVVISGSDYTVCRKWPLEFNNWDDVGLFTWPQGVLTLEKVHDTRREVSGMIKRGKRQIVIDLTGVKELHVNLMETLSDLYDEVMSTHPDGTITVINLDPQLHTEFREFSQAQNITLVF